MAYNKKSFKIKGNSGQGVFMDSRNSNIEVASGYVGTIPSLWASDGFDLQVDCYEDFDSTARHDFGSDAIAQLWIKKRNSIASAVLIDSDGTVATDGVEAEYYVVTFDVAANTISTLAPYLAGEDCLLFAEVVPNASVALGDSSSSSTESIDEDEKTTFAQEIKVIDENGDLSADQRYDSSDFPVDGDTLTTSQTLTAYPGRVVYIANGSGMTLTLPSASVYPKQELEIVNIGAYDVSVTGAIGGTVTLESDDTGHFLASSGTWYQCVYPIADN